MGSDYKKPDAITEITRENYRDIVWTVLERTFCTLAEATAESLNPSGIYTDWKHRTVADFPLSPVGTGNKLNSLKIQFTNEIDIPNELSEVKIGKLELSGKIAGKGIERIKELFPNTEIKINGARISK